MKKLRVSVLLHEDLVPPDDLAGLSDEEIEPIKTEYDVMVALLELGHETRALGARDELGPLRKHLSDFKPHVVFNLLEEFQDLARYDQHVVAYLELMRVPYTGCNPRGLVLGRDKALSKKILHYHRIPAPRFAVFPRGRRVKRPRRLEFPVIVKSLVEESSLGISQASVAEKDEELVERVRFVHERIGTDAIAEQYIEGREVYVAVLGNHRLQILPTWELFAEKMPADAWRIATRKVKWDLEYQKKYGIRIGPARKLPDGVEKFLGDASRRIYRLLGLSGYARLDFRLGKNGKPYFLEANPNPDIAHDEEFASAAASAGISYEQLVQKILGLGLRAADRG